MKKVMFYCLVFHPENSGYANAFRNLIEALLDHDKSLTITVVTPTPLGGTQEVERDRLAIVRVAPKINVRFVRYFMAEYFYAKDVSRRFRSGNFDMLLVESFDPAIFIAALDDDVCQKTAVRVHATNETEYTFYSGRPDYRLRRALIRRWLRRRIKWFLSTNAYHVEFVKKHFFRGNLLEIGDASFFVLPTPVVVSPPGDCGVADIVRMFVLGRMDYLGSNQKGFVDLFHAMRLLPTEILGQFTLTVVGKGDMRERLMKLAAGLPNVTFIESLSHRETLAALRDSDVVVLPSRYEGLSMFALEALATGNACIFSRTGGLVDMVDGNGILFDPQNVEALAASIMQMMTMPRDQLAEMKRRSIDICKDRFSPKRVAAKFEAITSVISGS